MTLNHHHDRIDDRIRAEVTRSTDAVLEFEYRILEQVHRSLGDNGARVLEVGCGSLGVFGRKGSRLEALRERSVGIDLDFAGLATNTNVAYRVCGSCYSLPIKDKSVDLILCRWMFEHLEVPERALIEFRRVLKDGGYVYIKTPNLWNYAMLVSRMTPTAFHNLFRFTTGLGENIPTFYRANTRRRLQALASGTGFIVRSLATYPYSYMYFTFSKELFLTMRAISKVLAKVTDRMQLTLCCVLQKV